jgi:hypothetical protein
MLQDFYFFSMERQHAITGIFVTSPLSPLLPFPSLLPARLYASLSCSEGVFPIPDQSRHTAGIINPHLYSTFK